MADTERRPPTGTVTMLFSDIEGSTRMLAQLGDAYAAVLTDQRRLLRSAFGRWHGTEMGTEGDSFFVAFPSARDAVHACIDGQRALSGHSWPHDAEVRVRMGLHTGEPVQYEDGYVGMDVHLAARIAATAHGGQVVLSAATTALAGGTLPDGTGIRDLGEHRLKDIPEPQRLHQLVLPGLRADFPALRSLGASSNLPASRTPLVGRHREQAEVADLLTAAGQRLLTITGAGGSGKTRLAVEVADALSGDFPDGVYFVPLATVSQPAVVWTTLAESLGLTGDGKRPAALFEHLADKRMLLVLDNLEQIADAGGSVVAQLLELTTGPTVLATSRRPLHVLAEQEYPLGTLDLPPGGTATRAAAEASSAVSLFVQRARLVKPGFALTDDTAADVVALCRHLDGLPLALELAASRVRLLSPRALLDRLDSSQSLGDSAAGRPRRHHTLHATMSWSYDLLPPGVQRVFRRLAVLSGGGTLEAVSAVTGDPDPLSELSELVEASLVRLDDGPDGAPRVRLLQTVRRFAAERAAEAGELDDLRRRHAEHYAELAARAAQRLRGPDDLSARALLTTEADNLRAALAWALGEAGSADPPAERVAVGLRLCHDLGWFWYAGGYLREGRHWLERASRLASEEQGPELAGLLHRLGIVLAQQGRHRQARDLLAKALRIRRRVGDEHQTASTLNSLGVVYRNLGDPDRARENLQESVAIARELDHPQRLASALSNLAMLELDEEHPDRAIELITEVRQTDQELGDAWAVAGDHANLSTAYLQAGRAEEAFELLCEVVDDSQSLGDLDLTLGLVELLAVCAAARGDHRRAAVLLGATDALRADGGVPLAEPDRRMLDRMLARWLDGHDPTAWSAHRTEGAGLSTADAVRLATGPS